MALARKTADETMLLLLLGRGWHGRRPDGRTSSEGRKRPFSLSVAVIRRPQTTTKTTTTTLICKSLSRKREKERKLRISCEGQSPNA